MESLGVGPSQPFATAHRDFLPFQRSRELSPKQTYHFNLMRSHLIYVRIDSSVPSTVASP